MVPKCPTLFALMVGLWGLWLLYIDPRLLALLIGPEPLAAKLCVVLFILTLNLSWFYVFYHLVIIGCSYLTRSHTHTLSPPAKTYGSGCPAVALLYTTCNDFQEDAARSHLNQDYNRYHFFVLDDSSQPGYRARIDAFAKLFPGRVTVIRRSERTGFKAGNVNHAIRLIGDAYDYFSISDADTVLPPNFIRALLPYVQCPRIAFAQAAQAAPSDSKTSFARFMAWNTNLHFRHYASTKNRYGFVMFYGHGAVLRTDVWRRIGGFPEIATEDLAYSMKMRELGYEGVFVNEVVCAEEFPPTYKQFRKRNEKWIRGTAECLWKYCPSFVKAAHIPWFEKLDVLVSGGSLLTALPFMVFLALVGICLPLFFAEFRTPGLMVRLPVLHDMGPIALALQLRSNVFWTWDWYLLMLLSVWAPLIPVLIELPRQPKRMFQYLAAQTYHTLATQVVSALNLASFFLTKRAPFPVTGEIDIKSSRPPRNQRTREWLTQPHTNRPGVFLAEVLGGTVCWAIAIMTQNIWFVTIAAALWCSPLVFRWNLETRLVRSLVFVPLVLTCVILVLVGKNLVWP